MKKVKYEGKIVDLIYIASPQEYLISRKDGGGWNIGSYGNETVTKKTREAGLDPYGTYGWWVIGTPDYVGGCKFNCCNEDKKDCPFREEV